MTFMIAEIGINHNGSVELAKEIINAAKWAGADCVKFQKRDVATVYAGEMDKPRESPWGETLGAQKYGLEFNQYQYDQINEHCRKIKMPWFASAWDVQSLEFLSQYELPYNKIASAMITAKGFLQVVASESKPTFISTAMATTQDIQDAIDIFQEKAAAVTLMHCVGVYPCPEHWLNLHRIVSLHEAFGLPVGYSGHENSVSPSVVAAVLGAVAIERHITTDRSMYGSDQAASLEPHGFKQLVDTIAKVPKVMGDGQINTILPEEQAVAKKLRYWER